MNHMLTSADLFRMAKDHLSWARKFRSVGDSRYSEMSVELARDCHFKAREILRGVK